MVTSIVSRASTTPYISRPLDRRHRMSTGSLTSLISKKKRHIATMNELHQFRSWMMDRITHPSFFREGLLPRHFISPHHWPAALPFDINSTLIKIWHWMESSMALQLVVIVLLLALFAYVSFYPILKLTMG